MKKKSLLLKGLLVSLMLLCAAHTWAYDFRTDGIFYNILSEDDLTCEVTYRYNNSSNAEFYPGDIVIPETTTYLDTTYSVIGIGSYAFWLCENLTGITIPNTVTSIGEAAFFGCIKLKEIVIPSSVTSIGGDAFSYCSITEITIPNGVTSIGDYTFYGCGSLAQINIPNSVTSIGEGAFSFCSSLTEITIPNSITSIGSYAFQYCTSLKEITIPNTVTYIGGNAFRGCESLKEITIPDAVTYIGDYAFWKCESLSSVTSLNEVPPTCASNSFNEVPTDTCILYIPLGTTKSYSTATGWKNFYYIEEIDTSGIETLTPNGAEIVGYYGIDGKKLNAPQNGINIVRYSDGTTRKILVQ